MNWLFGSVLTFQLERAVFLREQANNMYSPYTYFMAKNIIETPVAVLTPMIQLLVMFWGIKYINFLEVFLVMLLVSNCAMGIGLLISAASPNMPSATSIAPLFTMPMILFGGLFSNTDNMPAWLGWLQWISPIRYGNEGMAHSQYDGVPGLPAAYLEYSGFTLGYWNCIWANLALLVFWRIAALVALRLQIRKFQ